MVDAVVTPNPDGEVMAPAGSHERFIRGRRVRVRIIALGNDPNVPTIVHEAMVGLIIDVVFTREQIATQIGEELVHGAGADSRFAYVGEIIEAFREQDKLNAMSVLSHLGREEFDLFEIQEGTFELIGG